LKKFSNLLKMGIDFSKNWIKEVFLEKFANKMLLLAATGNVSLNIMTGGEARVPPPPPTRPSDNLS
jgi:hypothetical protein